MQAKVKKKASQGSMTFPIIQEIAKPRFLGLQSVKLTKFKFQIFSLEPLKSLYKAPIETLRAPEST